MGREQEVWSAVVGVFFFIVFGEEGRVLGWPWRARERGVRQCSNHSEQDLIRPPSPLLPVSICQPGPHISNRHEA